MVVITLGNSYSSISGLSVEAFKELRKELSYSTDAQAAYFAGGFARIKYLLDKRGSFPSGLLSRVTRFLRSKAIVYQIKDSRLYKPYTRNNGLKPHITPYVAQDTALTNALKYGSGCISMPTGSGKSLVIALIASTLNLKTLVVCPTLEIKSQLIEGFKAVLKDASNITVENIDSRRLKTLKGYDCLIIDEAHHSAAKTYHTLNKTAWKDIYWRFCLTATPFRNQTEETLLFEAIAGKVIYKLSYREAVEQKFIVPIESYYIEVPKQDTDAYSWQQVYKELVVNNDSRNTLIAGLVESLKAAEASTLCLVKEIAHGKLLSEMTGIPFANGQDEDTKAYIKQFNAGKIKSLIGTTGVLGEGIDSKPCEYVIIAGLGKAKSAFMQQVGRSVRVYGEKESGKVILILDRSHKFTLKHFKMQTKILKEEYGSVSIKLEI